jgi:hypothetical protein
MSIRLVLSQVRMKSRLFLIDQDGAEKVIGEVLLKKSALNEVRLNKVRSSAYGLKDGDPVFFRTKQDRASYRKTEGCS